MGCRIFVVQRGERESLAGRASSILIGRFVVRSERCVRFVTRFSSPICVVSRIFQAGQRLRRTSTGSPSRSMATSGMFYLTLRIPLIKSISVGTAAQAELLLENGPQGLTA
jgi:hypothetical protein